MAVIAVLVAVAIPTFGSQLEKSRQATDHANLRNAYAAAKVTILQSDEDDNPIKKALTADVNKGTSNYSSTTTTQVYTFWYCADGANEGWVLASSSGVVSVNDNALTMKATTANVISTDSLTPSVKYSARKGKFTSPDEKAGVLIRCLYSSGANQFKLVDVGFSSNGTTLVGESATALVGNTAWATAN